MSGFRTEVLDGGIVVLTIDRPKANAIDSATSVAMGEAFVAYESDPSVRVVIVTGAGERFFCAGWDLGAAADGESFDVDNGPGGFGGFPDLPDRSTPVIVAVNGMAVGGGFEITMAADLIVAADHATFFLPEPTLGIFPDAASVRLPKLLPPHIAREMLYAGKRMDAAEAARWGIVNQVVPGAELMDAAVSMARRVCASAPLSIAAMADIARRTATMEVVEAMGVIKGFESYQRCINSADATEGNDAWMEKRPPVWQGR